MGLVGSGTTSKQIDVETDCRLVGYGGMLFEALVAVVALATLMVLPLGDASLGLGPDRIYAAGLARFVERFGINPELARNFALLAFATFIYDTLDVTTRLGRYMLQELTGWKGVKSGMVTTLLTLALRRFLSQSVSLTRGKPRPRLENVLDHFRHVQPAAGGAHSFGPYNMAERTGRTGLACDRDPHGVHDGHDPVGPGRTIVPWAATPLNNPHWETIPVVAVILIRPGPLVDF
jgi:hypothetical protein